MKNLGRSALALALCTGVTAGCYDLDIVSNQSAPTAAQVLSDPAELELVVAGTWGTLWAYTQDNPSSFYATGALGQEWVSGNSTLVHSAQLETDEGRAAYPNDYSLSNRFVAQNPWYAIYEGIDNATQALIRIEKEGVRIVSQDEGQTAPSDNTRRARVFSYYTQGALYGLMALNYDKASISLHTTDRSKSDWWKYVPYTEVAKVAYQQLGTAIALAESGEPFTTPATWMAGATMNNQRVVEMANTWMARIMTYLPRTPAERRDVSQGGIVDWRKVIEHANKGVKSDILVTMSSTGFNADHIRYHASQTIMVADPRSYGPADVSGAYEAWINSPVSQRNRFRVVTPDRRITGKNADGTPNPTANGTYFRYLPTCCSATWNSYQFGHYAWNRMGGRWNTGTKLIMSVDELNLLKAEAHFRLGELEQAAALVNITRVANGGLPPVTAAGVPGTLDTCVPRTLDGKACGTLLDALHYERMIELFGLMQNRSWWDRRGFGTLSKGTYTQLPIPVRELQALGNAFYTFGGDEGSAADGMLQVR